MSLFDDDLITKEPSLEEWIRMDFEETLRKSRKMYQKRHSMPSIGRYIKNRYYYINSSIEQIFRCNEHWTIPDPDHGMVVQASHSWNWQDVGDDVLCILMIGVLFEDGVNKHWEFEGVF